MKQISLIKNIFLIISLISLIFAIITKENSYIVVSTYIFSIYYFIYGINAIKEKSAKILIKSRIKSISGKKAKLWGIFQIIISFMLFILATFLFFK